MKNANKLEILRHSAAHVLAAAVLEMFPEAKFGMGPAIENGFYYDFELPRTLIPEDLPLLEERMRRIISENHQFEKAELPADKALENFKKLKQDYKTEIIKDLEKAGEKKVCLYTQGSFVDLCSGPHLDSTGELKADAFKLTRISGAYWKGDEKNKQLQRIYGVAFENKKELDEYLEMQAEAEKRDHRKIGQEQELFFIDEMVGKGLVMWLPKGVIIRNEIEKLAVEMESKNGYVRVATPHLAKEQLYKTSGHLPYYKDSMYPAMKMDDGTYYLKAMNCPHHHRIFAHKQHSYKELPIRIAEYGTVYRNERSGTLAGLLRVRGLAMNDAHIYCTKDQIKDEFKAVMKLTLEYFKIFGLKDYWFRLSKWDPAHTEKYINEPENWKYTENIIREVLKEMKVKFMEAEDEAAFYGPKVDIQYKSIIGREETMSTIQLDFSAKERFKLNYIDREGKKNGEVFVIHRSPLSTHERFLAFLIEHYAGAFPIWLSPVQVVIIPVSEKFNAYAEKVNELLIENGIRSEISGESDTLGKRISEAEKQKIPFMLVVGQKEMDSESVAVRQRDNKEQEIMKLLEFAEKISQEIKEKK